MSFLNKKNIFLNWRLEILQILINRHFILILLCYFCRMKYARLKCNIFSFHYLVIRTCYQYDHLHLSYLIGLDWWRYSMREKWEKVNIYRMKRNSCHSCVKALIPTFVKTNWPYYTMVPKYCTLEKQHCVQTIAKITQLVD